MPKAQVLVTITAEALVDVPADVQDVEGFIRQNVGLAWGGLELASVVQTPGITLDYFVVPEPEPVQEAIVEPEPVAFDAESTIESATEESVVDVAETVASSDTAHVEDAQVDESTVAEILARFDDPVFAGLVKSAIRARAAQLLDEVVQQVVSELEPLLQRHLARNPDGNK